MPPKVPHKAGARKGARCEARAPRKGAVMAARKRIKK